MTKWLIACCKLRVSIRGSLLEWRGNSRVWGGVWQSSSSLYGIRNTVCHLLMWQSSSSLYGIRNTVCHLLMWQSSGRLYYYCYCYLLLFIFIIVCARACHWNPLQARKSVQLISYHMFNISLNTSIPILTPRWVFPLLFADWYCMHISRIMPQYQFKCTTGQVPRCVIFSTVLLVLQHSLLFIDSKNWDVCAVAARWQTALIYADEVSCHLSRRACALRRAEL